MLSILIPIYNQDVRPLVYTLSKQCNKLRINHQILCFDDGSEQKYKEMNHELAFKIDINYTEMTENLGRSRIRNWLGKAAYFKYLLFLDGDSIVKSKDFIKNYLDNLDQAQIIYGGRTYGPNKPKAKKKILHWKYGTKREALPARKRKRDPWLNFQSNNFLITEELFTQFSFDESFSSYGYEDLHYAGLLKKSGISIGHIDNPVIHGGLEVNTVFLNKTENAIENLANIYKQDATFATRLTRSYTFLSKYGLLKSFERVYRKIEEKIHNNLLSQNPSISLFNLWKLHIFSKKLEKE
ncbi:MAG: glycosyltransferase [Saprospiraceae bacterium]|jgi:hypothetical protein|nr:glycosyltransferase [Saprospiraceae bacterium]MBL0027258.1 glycosyltransferase [Saprospiraceae bacterium]